jgi:hypothetical protein
MYTQKEELTLFCGFDVTPWPLRWVNRMVTPVKWKYNSFPGFRRDSGKFESEIIARGPRNNGFLGATYNSDDIKTDAPFPPPGI